MRKSRFMIILLIGLAFLQVFFYGPRLPDPMATRFDGAGVAEDWSARSEFLVLNLAFIAGMGLLFLGVPALVRRIPNAYLNMPNKDYWLAPERREATLDALARAMEWLAAATLALLLGITQLTINANLSGNGTLGDAFWPMLGGYLVLIVAWLVMFLRRTYAPVPRHDGL